uniref:Ku C-terminal domain-containing protein n=1 Tax=Timema tahoe TaxID=61484 RepID=A0A7R9IIK0_9NEOP|nr:unnamed protein product [Timema tahoe]
MEIHSMIQTPNENLEENLATLAQALEIELKIDDIETAHRLPTPRANRQSGLPPPQHCLVRRTRWCRVDGCRVDVCHFITDIGPASDGKFYPFEEYNEANHTSLKGIFSKDVTEVGTITPEQDFLTLLKKGEPFYTVSIVKLKTRKTPMSEKKDQNIFGIRETPQQEISYPVTVSVPLPSDGYDYDESEVGVDNINNIQQAKLFQKYKPTCQDNQGSFRHTLEYEKHGNGRTRGVALFLACSGRLREMKTDCMFAVLTSWCDTFDSAAVVKGSSTMQDAIMKLVMHSFGSDGFIKAVAALKLLREKCKELFPDLFNQWLLNLKENLIERGKVGFWNMILKVIHFHYNEVRLDNIGLISVVENPGSTVTAKDAEIFFINSVVKATDSEEDLMDAENLFDEMYKNRHHPINASQTHLALSTPSHKQDNVSPRATAATSRARLVFAIVI